VSLKYISDGPLLPRQRKCGNFNTINYNSQWQQWFV